MEKIRGGGAGGWIGWVCVVGNSVDIDGRREWGLECTWKSTCDCGNCGELKNGLGGVVLDEGREGNGWDGSTGYVA